MMIVYSRNGNVKFKRFLWESQTILKIIRITGNLHTIIVAQVARMRTGTSNCNVKSNCKEDTL